MLGSNRIGAERKGRVESRRCERCFCDCRTMASGAVEVRLGLGLGAGAGTGNRAYLVLKVRARAFLIPIPLTDRICLVSVSFPESLSSHVNADEISFFLLRNFFFINRYDIARFRMFHRCLPDIRIAIE